MELLKSHRTQFIALLLVFALLAPQPANAQLGFLTGLIGVVTNGLNAISGVLTAVNNTLQNVIGPLLRGISSVMSAIQGIVQEILDFQQNVVYPLSAITRARALVSQVQGIYNAIQGIWNTVVRSATLANPQSLEDVILSKDAGQVGAVAARFSAVYAPLPSANDVNPATRDVIDSSDAASQAAMKRSMVIDNIADRELAAADQMMSALASTAPGTAEMIGAQAGAWVVRSQAYTQQALAELMRLRAIELAGQGARLKEAARANRETRNKLTQMTR
jgi:hypothetical protein